MILIIIINKEITWKKEIQNKKNKTWNLYNSSNGA